MRCTRAHVGQFASTLVPRHFTVMPRRRYWTKHQFPRVEIPGMPDWRGEGKPQGPRSSDVKRGRAMAVAASVYLRLGRRLLCGLIVAGRRTVSVPTSNSLVSWRTRGSGFLNRFTKHWHSLALPGSGLEARGPKRTIARDDSAGKLDRGAPGRERGRSTVGNHGGEPVSRPHRLPGPEVSKLSQASPSPLLYRASPRALGWGGADGTRGPERLRLTRTDFPPFALSPAWTATEL